jgi:hypothetical protein
VRSVSNYDSRSLNRLPILDIDANFFEIIFTADDGRAFSLHPDVSPEQHPHDVDNDTDKRHPPRHGLFPVSLWRPGNETIHLRVRLALLALSLMTGGILHLLTS